MASKKTNWISVKEAAAILTENSGHTVTGQYVRRLGALNYVETKKIDERTKLYSENDIRAYKVKPRGDGSVRREARAPRGGKVTQDKPAA